MKKTVRMYGVYNATTKRLVQGVFYREKDVASHAMRSLGKVADDTKIVPLTVTFNAPKTPKKKRGTR